MKNVLTNLAVWEMKMYPRLNLTKKLAAKFSLIPTIKENLEIHKAFITDISTRTRSAQLTQMFAMQDANAATAKSNGPKMNLNKNIVLHTQLYKIIAIATWDHNWLLIERFIMSSPYFSYSISNA